MDNQQNTIDEQYTTNNSLFLLPQGASSLKKLANWCMFFAILGVISIAFMVIGALGILAVGNSIPGFNGYTGVFAAVYLVIALVYAAPVYFMFKFSLQMKNALNTKNNSLFNEAFGKLALHFMIVGVLTIIFLVIYIGIIFMAMAGGLAALNPMLN